MIIIQAEDGAIITNPKKSISTRIWMDICIFTRTCPVRIG